LPLALIADALQGVLYREMGARHGAHGQSSDRGAMVNGTGSEVFLLFYKKPFHEVTKSRFARNIAFKS
jgi:hypothetical protein